MLLIFNDNSLAQIGQWPWSRNTLAQLTNQTYLAAALGFDVVFAEPDRSNPQNLISLYPENEILSKELNALPNNDQLFADAIVNHGTVVLGQALSNENQASSISNKYGLVTQGDDPKQFLANYTGVQSNIKSLEDVAQGIGSMSIGNNDAIVRHRNQSCQIRSPNYSYHSKRKCMDLFCSFKKYSDCFSS